MSKNYKEAIEGWKEGLSKTDKTDKGKIKFLRRCLGQTRRNAK